MIANANAIAMETKIEMSLLMKVDTNSTPTKEQMKIMKMMSPILNKEDKISVMEFYTNSKRKRLLYGEENKDDEIRAKRRKVMLTDKIFVKKIMIRSPLSLKMKTRSLLSVYEQEHEHEHEEEENKKNTKNTSPNEEEENKKNTKNPIPVYEAAYNHFDRYEEEISESEEEVLFDGERD